MRHTVLALLLILAGITAHPIKAQADELTAGKQIKSIILEQIEALKRSDAAKAYSYAASAIKAQFPSPRDFIEMVRAGYQPLLTAQDIGFGRTVETDGTLFQEVWLSDTDGESWLGIYKLNQQQDGIWKINGVMLQKRQSTAS
ncbi:MULTISPECIES: DUF4864 domain-containing protein [Pseudovibrio]|uniref:DUF4864 domain-containing protein n=1 Tax=Stappiaceae TaxID=2821832 RepID=UPI0023665F0E|nr:MULTISPECIES: DUF4864 domain-containing protein [Pseudovibrio]MDD7908774.1 DUF4864 domain-containing protein [Pseudovibrio exalbescens]MDX5592847.1 DUF4864 domain-containing protein [Pseudovibrio sp. SPO723]